MGLSHYLTGKLFMMCCPGALLGFFFGGGGEGTRSISLWQTLKLLSSICMFLILQPNLRPWQYLWPHQAQQHFSAIPVIRDTLCGVFYSANQALGSPQRPKRTQGSKRKAWGKAARGLEPRGQKCPLWWPCGAPLPHCWPPFSATCGVAIVFLGSPPTRGWRSTRPFK